MQNRREINVESTLNQRGFINVDNQPGFNQSMEWIELKRSSPVQIHEPLILIQSNPAEDPESESNPVQSGHNTVGIYQIPCKINM